MPAGGASQATLNCPYSAIYPRGAAAARRRPRYGTLRRTSTRAQRRRIRFCGSGPYAFLCLAAVVIALQAGRQTPVFGAGFHAAYCYAWTR